MNLNLGYACINLSVGKNVTTNRGMIKKTFNQDVGLHRVSELALENAKDILKILVWNKNNNINFFRLSSAIIPWADSIPDITKLKDFTEISAALKRAGDYALKNNIRITSHPGPFVVLPSPTESVVINSLHDLEIHGTIFDMMGLSQTPYNKINIHCNGVYGDKQLAMDRFCDNFGRLSLSVRNRLTIENDDKASMYSVNDLMYIHDKIGIPIVFDYHHYKFCNGDLSEKKSLELAISTWPTGITPVVHYSESKALHENDTSIKQQAHSDYINELPNTYGNVVDIMLEVKMKELALLKIRNTINNEKII